MKNSLLIPVCEFVQDSLLYSHAPGTVPKAFRRLRLPHFKTVGTLRW
jgi:hypothetical protein